MKKRFMKFIYTIAVITTVVLSFPINVIASTLSNNYSDGDIRYEENSIGDTKEKGSVKLTKKVSKVDNTDDEFLVSLEVKGKNDEITQSTEVTPYIVFVLDISTTMEAEMKEDDSCYYCNESTRFEIARDKAIEFSKKLLEKYPNAKIGLVEFGYDAKKQRDFLSEEFTKYDFTPSVSVFDGSISGLESATNIASGIRKANEMLSNKISKHIIVLTDGYPESYDLPYGVDETSDNYDNDTIKASSEAKNNNVEIFTIGFGFDERDERAYDLLTTVATDKNHFAFSNDGTSLTEKFSAITSSIKVPVLAGTKAIITDTISKGFTYVNGSANPSSAVVNGNVIKFNIGDITENGTSVSFKIKADKNNMPKTNDNFHPTNDVSNNGVNVSYKSSKGNNVTKSITKSSEVYYKLKLNYIINYYKDSINNNPFDIKEGSALKGEVVDVLFDNIPRGYTNNSSNITSFTVDSDNMVINIIYNKMKLSYIVEYYEEDNKISDDRDNTFDEDVYFGDKIEERLINKNKYKKFGYKDGIIKTDMPYEIKEENNIIKVCYEKRRDMSYTVRYIDEDTNKKLYENKTVTDKTYNETYEEEALNTPVGYRLVSNKKQTITLDKDDKVLTFYYKKKNDMSYKVRYVEIVNNNEIEILDSKTVTNKTYNETYEEEAKEAPFGYKLVGDKIQSITLSEDNMVLTFYYEKRNDMSYTVKYIDKDTNESIIPNKEVNNKTYNEEIEEFACYTYGYYLVGESMQKFNLDSDNKVITFYYKKIKGKYTVKYVEKETELEIAPSVKKEANLIDPVIEKAIEIKGYYLVSDSEFTIELNEREETLIVFYYEKKDMSYTVKYLDNDTKKELAPSIIKKGKYLDEITEKSINIDGYKLVSFKEVKIKLDDENKTVVFYYEKEMPEVNEVVKTGVDDDNNYLLLTLLFGTITSLGYVLKKRFN